ncbi:MAG: B12-binding domain-containing radical SAM protein [Lentisphaeria bacterium]|jgi:hypothetical protein
MSEADNRQGPRIVWLDLNASHAHTSLALPLLHAACVRQGVPGQWAAVTATAAEPPGTSAATVAAQAPEVLAATAWLFTVDALLAVVRRVKALDPRCRVILGGPEFLGDNLPFLRREPAVDAVLRGEGEESFPRWLRHWDKPAQWHDIPGLCWLDPATGAFHDNGRAAPAEFAALPAPWESPFFAWDRPFIQLETVRGCRNRCAFCTSGGDWPLRALSLEEVRRRLATVRARGIREVRLLDRTFNGEPRRALELLRLFQAECPEARFHLEVHPGLLTAELRAALAAAPPGRLHLEAGLQTTHPAALAACGRAGELERCREGLAFLCGLRNLEVHVDLLAGLPELPLAHLLADLAWLAGLGPAEIQLETLKVLPGTALREAVPRRGLVFAPDPPYEILRTPQMAAAELQAARLLSRVVDGFYNAPPWRPAVCQAVADCGAGFLLDLVAELERAGCAGQPLSLERRGRFLHAVAAARCPAAAARVELEWLRAGLPPAGCPGGRLHAWKGAPPAGAELVERHPGCDPARLSGHVRVFCLEQGAVRHWLAFDRAVEPTRPVARWRCPGGGS